MIEALKRLFLQKRYFSTQKGKYRLRKWSREIIKRDRKCDICGSKRNLQAHHLYDKIHYPQFAYFLSNGITLCRKHHEEFHTKFMGGYSVACTPDDYKRYKKTKQKTGKIVLKYFALAVIVAVIQQLFNKSDVVFTSVLHLLAPERILHFLNDFFKSF